MFPHLLRLILLSILLNQVSTQFAANQYPAFAAPPQTQPQQYSANQYPAAQSQGQAYPYTAEGQIPQYQERQPQFIQRDSDLNCDFDGPCRWRNGTNGVEDDFDWLVADQVVVDSWHSIPRGKDGPGDLFTYVRGKESLKEAKAFLISDPINCQSDQGKLMFWYWKTAIHPTLRVCVRKPPGTSGKLTCHTTIHGLHRQEWIKETVKIPKSSDPFEIVFDATAQHTYDTLGLDEITYDADLCGTTGESGTSGLQPAGREESTACSATDCAFDKAKTCSYSNGVLSSGRSTPGVTIKKWLLSNRQVSNSLTGIFADKTGSNELFRIFDVQYDSECIYVYTFDDGTYAYAGNTVTQQDTFVMESPKFSVSEPARVDFAYYLAGIEGRLRACINNLANCPFESLGKDIKSDARRWRPGSISLEQPGTYSVIFVADDLEKNYVVGLDDVGLHSSSGGILQCTVQGGTTSGSGSSSEKEPEAKSKKHEG